MPLDLPPVTRNLLIANVVVYLLQQFFGEVFLQYFALWPWGPDQVYQTAQGLASIGFRPWQLVTYAFMHGGLPHIAFNMFALFMFGGTIERTFGARNFIVYYFVCAIVAAIAQLLVLHYFSPEKFFPTLGASGAIFGLLLVYVGSYMLMQLTTPNVGKAVVMSVIVTACAGALVAISRWHESTLVAAATPAVS